MSFRSARLLPEPGAAVRVLAALLSVAVAGCAIGSGGLVGAAASVTSPPSAADSTDRQTAVPAVAGSTSPTVPTMPAAQVPLPDYINRGSPRRKWIALTIDADMYPWMYAERDRVSLIDLRIVDLLERTHTPATIFLNGLFAQAYPDVVERLAADPTIELGNHSWDHAGWTAGCPESSPIAAPMTKRSEVTRTAGIVAQLTGRAPQFFRFPGFCRAGADVRLVLSLGEVPVGAGCAFGDTFGWSARRQVTAVQEGCGRGSIVVTHLNGAPYHPNVYEALETLIPWWKSHGWTIVNVGQMFSLQSP
jgi:peptidoglycan-N-acetylglucosamine deacetylase